MGLPHGRRQAPLERPEQLAEPAIAISLRMNRRVFLPEDRQADPGALHLTRQRAPVRLGVAPSTRLATRRGKQQLLDRRIRQIGRQWPAKPHRARACQIVLHRAAAHAHLAGDDPGACVCPEMQLQDLSYPPHGQPLRRHPIPSIDYDGGTLEPGEH